MRRWLRRASVVLLLSLGLAARQVEKRLEQRVARRKARWRKNRRWMIRGAVVFVLVAGLVGVATAVAGLPPISAASGHWAITEWFLQFSKRRAVATHSMTIEPPALEDPALVLAGAGHYETGCAFCHGVPGAPMPAVTHAMLPHPPRLSRRVQVYDDAALFYIVAEGLKFTGMPAWPAQDRLDEVWALVAFLRKLPELDEQSYRALVFGEPRPAPEGAPEVVQEVCARCHGADGLGRGVGAFPRLAGQQEEYLRRSLEAYRSGDRHSGFMQPIAVALTPPQIAEVARWYAQLPPPPPALEQGSELGAIIATSGLPEHRVPACAECHGTVAGPEYPAYPRLAGQHPGYLEQQLLLLKSGHRGGTKYAPIMHDVATHWLEPQYLDEVARYYASLGAPSARP